ncbi:MAG: hypothetical protein K5686_11220 [Lachnospiraceae bacterium]|nr:hypothetical protein [Lachnospiraceae bacterium]
MKGFYSLWTAPYFVKGGESFHLEDYEIATLLLSVAAYQAYNGPVRMYADDTACSYLEEEGIADIFERGVVRMEVPDDIDPKVYWAAGKMVALSMEDTPAVMIDTDLIIWKNIEKELKDAYVKVIHREELNPEIYPDPGCFEMKKGYEFPAGWDFKVLPANTALLYIADADLKDKFTCESLKFMKMSEQTDDKLCHMVFAEQRILPMCAAAKGYGVEAFCSDPGKLREQSLFTHIWGHKNVFKFNMDERRAFCRRCVKRLAGEFPLMYVKAREIKELEDILNA